MNIDEYASEAFNELKNNTLLLTTANEHLAEEIFLNKIGKNIRRAVELIERDISSLKKEYPGKFVNEVDTDSILEKIDHAAQRMLKPGKEVMDHFKEGGLGREMESHLLSIRRAVDDIRTKVRGSHPAKAARGSAFHLFNPLKELFHSTGRIFSVIFKILACIIVLGCVVFAYLFITMEKEPVFLNEIAACQSLIKEKGDNIGGLEIERQDLYEKRSAMKSDPNEMSRVEKVAALELEMEIKKIDDRLNQLEAELAVQEKNLIDNQEKLARFREKTFISKLLRQ